MRSIYFPIIRKLHREREKERHEIVKPQKWYYLYIMRSTYFPINRRLHRERHREKESKREKNKKREKETEM